VSVWFNNQIKGDKEAGGDEKTNHINLYIIDFHFYIIYQAEHRLWMDGNEVGTMLLESARGPSLLHIQQNAFIQP